MFDLETEFCGFFVTARDKKESIATGFLMTLVLFAAGLLGVLVCVSQTSD